MNKEKASVGEVDIGQVDQFVDINSGTQIVQIRLLKPDSNGKPRPDIRRGVASVMVQGRQAKFEFGFPPEMSLEDCFRHSEEFGRKAFADFQKEQSNQIILPKGVDMSQLKKAVEGK